MKKTLLAALILSGATFIGFNRVDAKENFDLTQKNYKLSTGESVKYFGNSMIIGERIYTLDSFHLSVDEVRKAVDAYRDKFDKKTPIYYLAGDGKKINILYEITGGYGSGKSLQMKKVDISKVFKDNKMPIVTAINEVPLDSSDIIKKDEQAMTTSASNINSKLKNNQYGVEKIAFKNKTLTVTISDLDKPIKDIKQVILDEANSFLENKNVKGIKSITFNKKTINFNNLNLEEIEKFAEEVLTALSVNKKAAKDLVYRDVANKSITLNINYYSDGLDLGTEKYTLKFAYDEKKIVAEKEQALTEFISDTFQNGNLETYGFSEVKYENNTLSFAVKTGTNDVATLHGSGIINMFLENYKDAKQIIYTVGKETTTIDVPANVTSANVEEWAIQLLEKMSGKKANLQAARTISTVETGIKLSDLIGKKATARVIFEVNGEKSEQSYTLEFTPDYTKVNEVIDKVKTETLEEVAKKVKEKIQGTKGISEIVIENKKTNPVINFKINDKTQSVMNFAGLGLTDVVKGIFTDAKKVSYTIKNKNTITQKNQDVSTDAALNNVADQLKADIANSATKDNKIQLQLSNYINCTIDVTVTYDKDGVQKDQKYQIKFTDDTAAKK